MKSPTLPFLRLLFIGNKTIMAAGYDCSPALLQGGDGVEWKVKVERLDAGAEKKSQASGNTAFNKFKQMDSRAQETSKDLTLSSVHQNTIV